MSLGRLVALVKAQVGQGLIIMADGAFVEEVVNSGHFIEDHDMAVPQFSGLGIYEGFVHVTDGQDPDVVLEGEWRRLTHFEMCRLAFGRTPWTDKLPGGAP